MPVCPDGHPSQTTDFCDVCGAPLPAGAPAVSPTPSGSTLPAASGPLPAPNTCPHCGAVNPVGALFCEACGYDYTTGALPNTDLATALTLAAGAYATPRAAAETSGGDPAPEPVRSETPALSPIADGTAVPDSPREAQSPASEAASPEALGNAAPATASPEASGDTTPATASPEASGDTTPAADPANPAGSPTPTADTPTDDPAPADVVGADSPAPADVVGTDSPAPADAADTPSPESPAPTTDTPDAPGDAAPQATESSDSPAAALSPTGGDSPNRPGDGATPDPLPGGPATDVPASPRTAGTTGESWVAEVWIDPDWYALQDSPDPLPPLGPPTVFPLADRSLIGRRSVSRQLNPEVDCGTDSGCSRRQAELVRLSRQWYVTDLDSANGTFVAPAGAPLPDQPISAKEAVGPDDRLYVGAWTRIVVRPAAEGEIESLSWP